MNNRTNVYPKIGYRVCIEWVSNTKVKERDKDDFALLDCNDAFAQDEKHERHVRFSAEAKRSSFGLLCWHQMTVGWCHLFTSCTFWYLLCLFWQGREKQIFQKFSTSPSPFLSSCGIGYWNGKMGSKNFQLQLSLEQGGLCGVSMKVKVKVIQPCPPLCDSMNFPGQNTGVGSLSLLQGIFLGQGSNPGFPAQGLNPGLPHCRQILYQLSHQGSPRILDWVAYPFSRGSSWPRDPTGVFCIQADSLQAELPGKPSMAWVFWQCEVQLS